MKFVALFFLIIFFVSCASISLSDREPEWLNRTVSDNENGYVFRGTGEGSDSNMAKNNAIQHVVNQMLERMGFDDVKPWIPEENTRIRLLEKDLASLVFSDSETMLKSLDADIIHNDLWFRDELVLSGLEVLVKKESFRKLTESLMSDSAGTRFGQLLDLANIAKKEGEYYKSALIWSQAASIALPRSPSQNYALEQVLVNLDLLDYVLENSPDSLEPGVNDDDQVVFRVTSGGKPVYNAEFLIQYIYWENSEELQGTVSRFYSDPDGIVRVKLPSNPASRGRLDILISPSADPFFQYPGSSNYKSTGFELDVEKPALRVMLEVNQEPVNLSMGILAVEKDLAGNLLDSNVAVRGLLNDLIAGGYDAKIIPFDKSSLLGMTESDLVNLVENDPGLFRDYGRVILCIVGLEGFEESNDSFSVRVDGKLIMVSPGGRTVPYISSVTKSSKASGSQQAINAAFRLVGRTFASQLVDLKL